MSIIDKTSQVATLEETVCYPGLQLCPEDFNILLEMIGEFPVNHQAWASPQHTQCLWSSYIRIVWGCYLDIHLSTEEIKMLWEMPGRSPSIVQSMDLSPTYTKLLG